MAEATDVVLVGGGIMSATLGVLLKELEPSWEITLIERLGAHQDGILRCHKLRKDGSVRDTVEYSLLREEWPQARVKLLEKAAAYDAS